MSDETVTNQNALKLVNCGCGGEAIAYIESMDGGFLHLIYVSCAKCGIRTPKFDTEAEAVTAWNRAMGNGDKASPVERTAKVIDKSVGRHSITDFDWTGICEKCGNEIQYSFDFCPYCGAKLDWSGNE